MGTFESVTTNTAIYIDRGLIKYLKTEAGFWWKMSWVYRSNWRVLHIDGFETGRRIPMYTGALRPFFQYNIPKDL